MTARKKHSDLIPAAEPPSASTAAGALAFAREQPARDRLNPFDFVPAMLELVAKGCDVEYAASQLASNGCQCSTSDLVQAFAVKVGRVA